MTLGFYRELKVTIVFRKVCIWPFHLNHADNTAIRYVSFGNLHACKTKGKELRYKTYKILVRLISLL